MQTGAITLPSSITGVNVFSEPPPFNASGALAINGSGQLVGTMQWPAGVTHPGSGEIGFFYDGVMVDINRLISASDPLKGTVTIESGVAINDSRLMLCPATTLSAITTRTCCRRRGWIWRLAR